MPITQVLLKSEPFSPALLADDFLGSGHWPCSWIRHPGVLTSPFVIAYRKKFTLESAAKFRVHLAADERYQLCLDGKLIGRGNERGDQQHWFYDSYDFDLTAGDYTLVARVWSLGERVPFAQISARHGFLFTPEEKQWIELLGTGIAEWEAKLLDGYEFISPQSAWGTGENVIINGAEFDWDLESEAGETWQPAIVSHSAISSFSRVEAKPVQTLTPAILLPQLNEVRHVGQVRHVAKHELTTGNSIETNSIPICRADHLEDEAGAWQELVSGQSPLTVPAHTVRRVLLDLEDYYCAYPELVTSGGRGSTVRVHWQESLYECLNRDVPPDYVATGVCAQGKGNRDQIEGKYFVSVWHDTDGIGDTFLPDGGQQRTWSTLWWQCGRYVEIVVCTEEEPLIIERLAIRETRYPLEMEASFAADDARLQEVIPIMTRVMQMCAHETYMDCPFYEQLQYIGDTRLEVLATYIMTRDDRLARKALQVFDWSRLPEGLTRSRYPSRNLQVIPPFSLWWITMVHDFALWRDDMQFVRSLMPGVRAVLDAFRTYQNGDGLIERPKGWNFADWVPAWKQGIPPQGDQGVSGVLNWQVAVVARQAAELEEWIGEPELATRQMKFARNIAQSAATHFWNEKRRLFADDLSHQHFSEHAQCLALLSGFVENEKKAQIEQGLLNDPNLERATIFFTFYLFETYRLLGRMDKFFERMELWFDLKNHGFKTTFEESDWNTTRSDCHAWGAHPLFHYFATLLGIRPTAPGFNKIVIAPQLGHLEFVSGSLPHPRGEIKVELKQQSEGLSAVLSLPAGVCAEFQWGNQTREVSGCSNFIHQAR